MRVSVSRLIVCALLFTPVAAKDDAWKVEDAHGPTHQVAFTTTEATWLPLDVHPDGTKIVASILGDLYLIPIGGGEAKRITSGPAYDAQPRFSPDGKWIAFASDRSGIENLWVCDLEGKQARQVSKEKDSTVNGPAWSPDGDYLVGRKRLTDASSLGTVELWMWHVRGGSGVQLTKKDEQPDAADPCFSKDGRFVYFSARDARYRYDRNVNEGIWQIKRFDRWNGQLVPVTGEFGGAAAPAISPDGASMAYVRRIRAVTVMDVMDLASGKMRQLASGLQRDNQEGFAFHGVFPGYAWTPDGKSIVTTADGKIWRYDAASGARTEIPFSAAVDQTVTASLHTPRRLGQSDVRARIIRWPVISPDGRLLVFSALGHLYAMDLPAGTPPVRVTTSKDLEYAPSFSRDGRKLTYVTWNDQEGGNVWTMPTSGAPPTKVTTVAGQYVNPSFSPDGSKIVYVAGSGASFRGEDLSDELWEEIRWVPASGGKSTYVIGAKNRGTNRRMTRPQFDAAGERIYYLEDDDAKGPNPPKSLLNSVKLDGTDKRTHLRWTRAEEASLSPDGKWVAFNEQYNAYVTALPSLGAQTVDIDLDGSALPLAKFTAEGGEWVNWADNGKTITWIWGPTFHRLAFDKAWPKPEDEAKKDEADKKADAKKSGDKKKDAKATEDAKKDDEEKLPESEAKEIVLTVPRDKPSGTVVYDGARIVTMKGDEVLERGTIVVTDDRIVSIGAKDKVKAPAGAKVVDVSGKTIIPGLFDEHAHLHYSTLDIFPERPWKYLANLAYGVTTTHDPSASNQEVFGQSEMVEAGLMTGPRIFSTGFILYGADLPGRAVIHSLKDAQHHLRRMKALGAFSVKSYMQPRREARQWIIKAARDEGMLVVPEGGGDQEMDMTFILDGHTTVEHALPYTPLRKDTVEFFAKSTTAYTPTLLVAYGGISGDKWFHQHYDLWKDDRLQMFVPQGIVDQLGRIRGIMATDPADWHHVDVAASAKDVLHAGGLVNLGAHGQMQGLGPHWEMWAFVQGGMTPLEALRVATHNPAVTLGLDQDLGSLEAGKFADFVVLDKNPLEDIHNSETVSLVVKNGRAYKPEDLKREK
ncbi:MAG TPA: amidohydrolase family protein [Candidatus Polarisedimenticolaceae bacterium]|nr:amidohydrolase family protein [Candidatus Polarisedimenticolaceae bacterium]